MAIDRTRRMLLLAGLLGPGFICQAAVSGRNQAQRYIWPQLLGAWESRGNFYAGVWSTGRGARGVRLPDRAHEVLADPLRAGQAIAVARRPGEYVLRFDARLQRAITLQEVEAERVFNGHAAFSTDGVNLFTSESDLASGQGLIGVRDAATFKKYAEFATCGIGPHALMIAADGTILVANGGILTLPESGRAKLSSERMDPSLVRLDAQTGRLLGQWRLPDPQLSIRHLAPANDGQVGIALQSEHVQQEQRESAPLLARFDGESLALAETSRGLRLGGYGGDIACLATPDGLLFAISCTRAGLVSWWDGEGRWLGATPIRNACALIASSGAIVAANEHGELLRATPDVAVGELVSNTVKWDNHLAIWR